MYAEESVKPASILAHATIDALNDYMPARRTYLVDETRWLSCTAPGPMLRHVAPWASARKLRLFACGYCLRLGRLWRDDVGSAEFEVALRFADNEATERQLWMANAAAEGIINAINTREALRWDRWERRGHCLAEFARAVTLRLSMEAVRGVLAVSPWIEERQPSADGFFRRAWESIQMVAAGMRGRGPEHHIQANLLRDVFGNPFRPVTVQPDWLTPTVVHVAQTIYAERTFDQLPVLADALEDADFVHAELLGHLRSADEHIRGCWALDLILSKDR